MKGVLLIVVLSWGMLDLPVQGVYLIITSKFLFNWLLVAHNIPHNLNRLGDSIGYSNLQNTFCLNTSTQKTIIHCGLPLLSTLSLLVQFQFSICDSNVLHSKWQIGKSWHLSWVDPWIPIMALKHASVWYYCISGREQESARNAGLGLCIVRIKFFFWWGGLPMCTCQVV